jgi:hypothetical protein
LAYDDGFGAAISYLTFLPESWPSDFQNPLLRYLIPPRRNRQQPSASAIFDEVTGENTGIPHGKRAALRGISLHGMRQRTIAKKSNYGDHLQRSRARWDSAIVIDLWCLMLFLTFWYVLQVFRPLRLNNDAFVLLTMAESAAHSGGFSDSGQTVFPPGYPALLAVLIRAGLPRSWVKFMSCQERGIESSDTEIDASR